MDFAMISVRDLSMRLASGGRPVDVLTEVSLEVPAGQFLAVAGPSGSGKSTLLGLIAGLDQPDRRPHRAWRASRSRALGEDALARFRRDTIGYVFQSYHLIPTLTALENVAVPLELARRARRARRGRSALLAEVGLADRAHHYPVQLSGGEQQRVAVARAVARRPRAPPRRRAHGQSRLGHGQADHRAARRPATARSAARSCSSPTTPALAARADRVVTLRDGRVVSDEPTDGRLA